VCAREREREREREIWMLCGGIESHISKFQGKRIRKPKCMESQEITTCKAIKGERERQR